jgi:hypothetical protein
MKCSPAFLTPLVVLFLGCQGPSEEASPVVQEANGADVSTMNDTAIDDLVMRSYQYVAMYNVNNKFAASQGGWNTCVADTELKDHTMRDIARPNNDTLYTSCLLDLTNDAIVINIPAFDSSYASLMVTGYDHYVNIPLASRRGDFSEPKTMLFFTERTPGYDGQPVDGIDYIFEATGDFISAVFRVMPHATEPERFQRIVAEKQSVEPVTLAEFQGRDTMPEEPRDFPRVGKTDLDVFENNLLEVMQFVFNHTTLDPDNTMDEGVLAAYAPLGIVPGQTWEPSKADAVDGARVREAAERIQRKWLGGLADASTMNKLQSRIFQPKGETDLEAVLAVSIIGPIGIPQEEAIYPQVATADGEQANAMHDYVIHMDADEMPPAEAFWSLTLYDLDEGFFIPNERRKYSVGENGGMQLNDDGGIDIYIAAEKPEGVPEENWLPIERSDLDLSLQLRLYVPDLEAYKSWKPPVAQKL